MRGDTLISNLGLREETGNKRTGKENIKLEGKTPAVRGQQKRKHGNPTCNTTKSYPDSRAKITNKRKRELSALRDVKKIGAVAEGEKRGEGDRRFRGSAGK